MKIVDSKTIKLVYPVFRLYENSRPINHEDVNIVEVCTSEDLAEKAIEERNKIDGEDVWSWCVTTLKE